MAQDREIVDEYLAAKQAYVDANNHDLTARDREVQEDQDRYILALEAYIADLHANGMLLPAGLESERASLRGEIAKRTD